MRYGKQEDNEKSAFFLDPVTELTYHRCKKNNESELRNLDALLERMNAHNAEAVRTGGVVIACGMSRFENDACVAPVFDRADQNMYENKNRLKAMQAGG